MTTISELRKTDTCSILGTPISCLGLDSAQFFCLQRSAGGVGGAYYFANVHTVTQSLEDQPLSQAMRKATQCFADGLPLVWVSRWKGKTIESRVCGPDFMREFLLKTPAESHGLIGGREEQCARILSRFSLSVCTVYSPPMRPFSKENVMQDLKEFEKRLEGRPWPRWIWVGLGAPKQELWIQEALKLYPQTSFFGVGAAFDFLSGSKPRAPLWMQKSGLEWFFRLISEPRRLARRYFSTNFKFLISLIFFREK